MAILKGNLRAVHGAEMVTELSQYALVNDIAEVYPGMMIAVPPTEWSFSARCSAAQVAQLLNDLAAAVRARRARVREGMVTAG